MLNKLKKRVDTKCRETHLRNSVNVEKINQFFQETEIKIFDNLLCLVFLFKKKKKSTFFLTHMASKLIWFYQVQSQKHSNKVGIFPNDVVSN